MAEPRDLERAREWQDPQEWNTPNDAPSKPIRHLAFVEKRDTPAESKRRQRQRPHATYELPPGFTPTEQKATRNARDRRVGNPILDNFPQLHEIEQVGRVSFQLGTENRYHSNHKGLVLHIWASDDGEAGERAVREVKKKINDWVREMQGGGSRRQNKFAKIKSDAGSEMRAQERELLEYNEKQAFCQEPSLEDLEGLPCIATFIWPKDSLLGHPQDILGRNWEALDPIRMEEKCYISCNRQNLMFKVQGRRLTAVKQALLRLRGCYFQVSARQIEVQTLYFLDPQTNYSGSLVRLVPEKQSGVKGALKMRPKADGAPKEINIMDSRIGMEGIKARNNDRAKAAAVQTLAGLRYYRGNLSMRIRLGTFLLTHYWNTKGEAMPREQFDTMMADPSMRGEVTESFDGSFNIQDLEAGNLPHQLKLDPINQQITSLPDAKGSTSRLEPVLAATFVLKDKATLTSKDNHEYLRLDIEFEADINGHMDRTVTRWSRITQQDGSLQKLLDINVIDIDEELAWNLELNVSHIISEDRMPALAKFAQGISVNRNMLREHAKFERVLNVDPSAASQFHLQGFTQRKVWRYRYPLTDYVAEIALTRHFKVANPGSILGVRYEEPPTKPYWTLHLSSDIWSKYLDQDGELGIGEGVDWIANATTFFPVVTEKHKSGVPDDFDGLVRRVEELAFMWRSGS